MNEDERDYLDWLIEISNDHVHTPPNYSELLELLHSYEFDVSNDSLDSSRAGDGLRLRLMYDPMCTLYSDAPCTFLELFLGLAIRIDSELLHIGAKGDRTSKWFWLMLENLGVIGCTNGNVDEDYVIGLLKNFINRSYDIDGTGGNIFVVNSEYDLRSLNLWQQANVWARQFKGV